MTKIGLYVGLLISLYSGGAFGEDVWSEWTTVTKLYPTKNEFMFYTEYANPGLSACSENRFSLVSGNTDYNIQVSVVIAAFMAGKEILLHLTPNDPISCEIPVDRFEIR